MSPPPMIQVDQLTRRYGSVTALAGISFTIPAGQVVGFLGPNGAGKTTTLKILTGYLAASGGQARVAGKPVDGDPSFRKALGYLPENAPVWPELTVLESLRFAARARGLRRAALPAAVDAAIERTDLGPMRHRPAGALSKGYRQRLGLAMAILHDPQVLVLDEPTTGLDPNQVVHIRALVRELGQDKTVLFSSHVLQEVQAVADRVLILDGGRLVADDAPDRLGARLTQGRLTVEIGPDAPAETVHALLAAVPGVEAVTRVHPEAGLCFELRAQTDVRAAVAAAVVGAGHPLLGLTASRADLEAVFRHVTKESAA
ncbi:MAG: ATP-binding cassette domain-containing protein [Myxococcales bacterium]|nr:ATP-binding cassette domain-containing protein [Myxococcales bacterium]